MSSEETDAVKSLEEAQHTTPRTDAIFRDLARQEPGMSNAALARDLDAIPGRSNFYSNIM